MGGEASRARHPGTGEALGSEALAPSGHGGPRNARGGLLPLAVRQRLWDQLWQRLLAPVPAKDQRDTDGEGR